MLQVAVQQDCGTTECRGKGLQGAGGPCKGPAHHEVGSSAGNPFSLSHGMWRWLSLSQYVPLGCRGRVGQRVLMGSEAPEQHQAHPGTGWSHHTDPHWHGGSHRGFELALLVAAPTAWGALAGKTWWRNQCISEMGCDCRALSPASTRSHPLHRHSLGWAEGAMVGWAVQSPDCGCPQRRPCGFTRVWLTRDPHVSPISSGSVTGLSRGLAAHLSWQCGRDRPLPLPFPW